MRAEGLCVHPDRVRVRLAPPKYHKGRASRRGGASFFKRPPAHEHSKALLLRNQANNPEIEELARLAPPKYNKGRASREWSELFQDAAYARGLQVQLGHPQHAAHAAQRAALRRRRHARRGASPSGSRPRRSTSFSEPKRNGRGSPRRSASPPRTSRASSAATGSTSPRVGTPRWP